MHIQTVCLPVKLRHNEWDDALWFTHNSCSLTAIIVLSPQQSRPIYVNSGSTLWETPDADVKLQIHTFETPDADAKLQIHTFETPDPKL